MNQTLQHEAIQSILHCPTCSTSRLYRLADGRFKCSLCRRVFSAIDNRHCRLTPEILQGLAHAFWDMNGTADTAELLNLNIKTVQKYFGLLRENLAKRSRQELIEKLGGDYLPAAWFERFSARSACGQNAHQIAAVVKLGDKIKLLLAAPFASEPRFAEEEIIGWLYAQDNDSMHRLNLDRIHCQAKDSNNSTLTTPFWRFIKQGLIHYQGGFRHHFIQYLREMEFRYNDLQMQAGPDICLYHLAAE